MLNVVRWILGVVVGVLVIAPPSALIATSTFTPSGSAKSIRAGFIAPGK